MGGKYREPDLRRNRVREKETQEDRDTHREGQRQRGRETKLPSPKS